MFEYLLHRTGSECIDLCLVVVKVLAFKKRGMFWPAAVLYHQLFSIEEHDLPAVSYPIHIHNTD